MCKKENFYTYLCSILLIMYEYLHNYELPQIQHNLCKIFTHFFYSVVNFAITVWSECISKNSESVTSLFHHGSRFILNI